MASHRNTVSDGTALVDAALAGFHNAALAAGETVDLDYRIAGRDVRFRYAGRTMASKLAPALAHLAVRDCGKPELTIHLFDNVSTNTWLPPLPWPEGSTGGIQEPRRYHDADVNALYEPGTDLLHMTDTKRGLGIYWTPSAHQIPYWESSFPMRMILHWWLRDKPFQPIHAGAVGFPGGGVLITGPSGSGKSTTTLSCLRSGLLYAGDDYVMAGTDPEPYVHSLYSTAKLEPDNLGRLPWLRDKVSNPDRLEEEKALVFLRNYWPDKLTAGFPIRAILIPRVTGRKETRLRRTTPQASFLAIAPTTVLHLKGAGDQAFSKIGALVRMVPSYSLEAGTDLRQIPEVITNLLERGGQ